MGNAISKKETDHYCSSSFLLHDCLYHFDEKTTHNSIEDLELPDSQDSHKLCRSMDNILSIRECDAIIASSEEAGFKPALLNVGFGREVYSPETRNSDRCIIDDTTFAKTLFRRIQDMLPQTFKDEGRNQIWKLVGLNERMRILKYEKGNSFAPHFDGQFRRRNGTERSFLSVMIYLNSGGEGGSFEGGSTMFLSRNSPLCGSDISQCTEFVPKSGSVLVFDHELLHEGALLKEGLKYAIRTDVMYRPGR